MRLTLVFHDSMPITFWDHNFTTIDSVSKFISSYVSLYNKQLEYMSLKVFGCLCFHLLMLYNQHRVQFRIIQCLYLGVSPTHKGHKCLNVEGRIFISNDVKFNETEFPLSKLFPSKLDENPKDIPFNHFNVPLIFRGSSSTIETNTLVEQIPHIFNLSTNPQDDMPHMYSQSTQLTQAKTLSEWHSPNMSHVFNTIQ